MSRRTMNNTQAVWLAGFLEGDGCFDCSNKRVRVRATGVDCEPLARCLEYTQRGNIYTNGKPRNGWQQCFKWEVTGAKALHIIDRIFYHLSSRKKDQVRMAILESFSR